MLLNPSVPASIEQLETGCFVADISKITAALDCSGHTSLQESLVRLAAHLSYGG